MSSESFHFLDAAESWVVALSRCWPLFSCPLACYMEQKVSSTYWNENSYRLFRVFKICLLNVIYLSEVYMVKSTVLYCTISVYSSASNYLFFGLILDHFFIIIGLGSPRSSYVKKCSKYEAQLWWNLGLLDSTLIFSL